MNEGIKKFLNNETYILAYRSNYDSARELNQQLIDYVKDLQNRIDKAIEYIEKNKIQNYDGYYIMLEGDCNKVIDILKESGE